MNTKQLQKIVKTLIQSKKEGDYWDFKQQYPVNNVDFIHDILCLGNNVCEKDGLLIYGVEDNTCNIVGISEDLNRKKQADVIDLLHNGCCFDGETPKITLHTILMESYELDIWIIQHYKDAPYRLKENYYSGKKKLLKSITHTRRKDVNTPKEQGANIDEMKLLWGKTSIPEFKLSLVQDNKEQTLYYKPPQKIATRNPLKRITNAELKTNPALSWRNSRACDYINHKTLGNLPGGITEEDNISDEDITIYNSSLPTQEQVNEYNKKQSLYENAKYNCYNFYLEINNIGRFEANNIDLIISFPKGLMVFHKKDVKNIEEPEPLEFPDHPTIAISRVFASRFEPAILALSKEFSSSRFRFNNIESNYNPIFSGAKFHMPSFKIYNDNSTIQLKHSNLLHTRNFVSDTFSIIVTKSGTFQIQYNIICKELPEAQTGTLKLIVNKAIA